MNSTRAYAFINKETNDTPRKPGNVDGERDVTRVPPKGRG